MVFLVNCRPTATITSLQKVVKIMFIKVFAALLLFQAIKAQNWCDSSLCGTSQHIACNHNGQFAPSCVNPVLVTMTPALINLVLNTHNSLRNTLASGAQTPLLRAARMATLVWNNDLAHFASLNVRSCVMRHDSCRNTCMNHNCFNIIFNLLNY